MAQKREKEETELKVTETIICTTPIPKPPKLSDADDQASTSIKSLQSSDPPLEKAIRTESGTASSPERSDPALPPRPQQTAAPTNRCAGCRRKVGLTGFRCRCGEMFCSEHRYSDRHDCSFDYKAAGREAIARENPVVRASKILKV